MTNIIIEPRFMQGPADAHPSSERFGVHLRSVYCDKGNPSRHCTPSTREARLEQLGITDEDIDDTMPPRYPDER